MTLYKLTNFKTIVEVNLDDVDFSIGAHAEANKIRVGKAANAVMAHLQTAFNPEENEQVDLFIEKLKLIDKQFEAAGQGTVFATAILTLSLIHRLRSNLDHTRHDIIKAPFILELKVLANSFEIEDKQSAAKKLYDFQKNILLPALQSIQNLKELLALESLVDDCSLLCAKLESIDTKNTLSNQKSAMLSLWNLCACKTDPIYALLTSYKKGKIPGLSGQEKREIVASKLATFIANFITHIENPAISSQDKVAIYNALKVIRIEYEDFAEGKKIDPILEKLSHAFEPAISARSTNVLQLISQFSQSAPLQTSRTTKTRAKTTQAPEHIRGGVATRIQDNIASLDINSPQFLDKIKQIKADICKVRDVDLTGLVVALDLLMDPKILQISEEESRFVELLLIKTCKSKADLDRYFNLNEQSVRDARQSLLKTLRNNATSLETLANAVILAKNEIRDQAIKDRFYRFVEIHKFPTFTQNFTLHFPILVKNFEAFTREVATKELEKKWVAILQMYDQQTDGKFSPLLLNYSYMDPRSQFYDFIQASQEKYFESLPLDKMDKSDKEKLVKNLQTTLTKNKDCPGQLFERNYMGMYSDMHQWLLENINHIKVPFNQGDDIHENLGNGVCYNNSLYRVTQILNDPKITPSQVLMGSNQKTRFCQSKVKSYYAAACNGVLTYQEADDEQTKIAGEYGLHQWHKYPLVTPLNTDPHEFLANEMDRFAKGGHTQFVMNLYKPKGGHAVNIQIDPKNCIYRLYDDNIGLCEYKDIGQFKVQIAKYFKVFYHEFTTYQFRLFQKK